LDSKTQTSNKPQKHARRCKKCTCGIPDSRLGGLFELKRKTLPMTPENTIKKKISYSAVVLTDSSRAKLLNEIGWKVPAGWEVIAHHVTINMGELPPDLKPSIGLPVEFQVIGYRQNDLVGACQVVLPSEIGKFVKNSQPHITIAVNRAGGGKPVMSNKMIEDDISLADQRGEIGTGLFSPFKVMGNIMEIPGQ